MLPLGRLHREPLASPLHQPCHVGQCLHLSPRSTQSSPGVQPDVFVCVVNCLGLNCGVHPGSPLPLGNWSFIVGCVPITARTALAVCLCANTNNISIHYQVIAVWVYRNTYIPCTYHGTQIRLRTLALLSKQLCSILPVYFPIELYHSLLNVLN